MQNNTNHFCGLSAFNLSQDKVKNSSAQHSWPSVIWTRFNSVLPPPIPHLVLHVPFITNGLTLPNTCTTMLFGGSFDLTQLLSRVLFNFLSRPLFYKLLQDLRAGLWVQQPQKKTTRTQPAPPWPIYLLRPSFELFLFESIFKTRVYLRNCCNWLRKKWL